MPITEKYIIVCDDFRREDNGKFILIGLYISDIQTSQIPVVMPTLTFFCELESDRPGTFRLAFKLRHEDGGRSIAEGLAQVPVNDPTQPIIMPIKIGGIQFSMPGLYTFSMEFDGQAPIVKTFNVKLQVPGMTQPGSSQNLR